jgi:NAD(P)H-hydrate epimerase
VAAGGGQGTGPTAVIPIVTAAVMADCDRACIETGTPGTVLMDRAGLAVARAAVRMVGGAYGRRIEILCGTGNNGGDGYAAARHLAGMGAAPRVVALGEPTGDAAIHRRLLTGLGIPDRTTPSMSDADLVIDAISGTGLHGALRAPASQWAAAANASGRPVLAVDVPSGVESDTGNVVGEAVRADRTLTLAGLKIGLVFGAGAGTAGLVEVAGIGIPVPVDSAPWVALDDGDVAAWRPRRPRDTHKWAAGSVLVVAGSQGMTGAGVLAASTALRCGAGLVVLALPEAVLPAVVGHPDLTEVMTVPHDEVIGMMKRFTAIAVGPGLRRGEAQHALVQRILAGADQPVVLDADGLNNVTWETVRDRGAPTVLTPHAGELRTLAGDDIERPLEQVPGWAAEWGCTLLLKGSTTVIADDAGHRVLNLTGRPELATAGSGDVLTGLVASLIAQGLEPWKATALAAHQHGLAGRGVHRATEVRDALEASA